MNDHNYWICFIFLYKHFTRLASKQYYSFGFFDTDIFMKCSLCVEGLPLVVNAVITSCLVGFWFFLIKIYVRRYLLRGLLSYRGWMCEYSGNRYLCSSSCLHRSWKRILIKWLAWRLANKQKQVIEKNENWIFWWIYNSLFLVLFSLNKVVSIACEGL